jgi:hypothetical protein
MGTEAFEVGGFIEQYGIALVFPLVVDNVGWSELPWMHPQAPFA